MNELVVAATPGTFRGRRRRLAIAATSAIVAMTLSGCGGTASTGSPTAGPQLPQATNNEMIIVETRPGVSPFISTVWLGGAPLVNLAAVEFTIAGKPGSVSKPVDVWYSMAALTSRGYVSTAEQLIALPVFGLYAGYANQVSVVLHFLDGSARTLTTSIATAPYVDPNGIYDQPTILVPRAAGSALGFDYFFIKSGYGSPVVVDTDAEIRWLAPFATNAISSAYQDGEFVIGDPAAPTVYRMLLDGTVTTNQVQSSTYTLFHHNIDLGNRGLFAEFVAVSDGVTNIETTVGEITDAGTVLNQWDLAAILSAYMSSQGDDPSLFVRPGVDWFHNNATAYDPSDDSIVVSSRENFVIKLDYRTGIIKWILGDPTKYWYTFPSLRAKALTLAPGGLYPIGQHGISITPDGLLMLFNDGFGSLNQPAGAPAGANRSYSAVSAYSIDAASMSAQDVWDFEYGQSLYSPICSSAYEAPGGSILVDYAVADQLTESRLMGLDSNRNVVFDFQFSDGTKTCDTSWNAVPIAFDNLTID
jgi:arylsulfate sulfotransferase